MNKNKIFAIFILIAILITCAGVSFASSDFDSHITDSDIDDLDYGLDDEELEEDFDDDLDDSDDDDWDDDSDDWDDDWDDDDWDDDSDDWDDDSDDDDWDDDSDDWDDDSDDDNWDDDSDDWDDDWDDDDWDDDSDDWDEDWQYGDIDWDFYYYDDLDFGYWEEYDLDWNGTYNGTGNVSIAKGLSFYKYRFPAKFNGTDNETYYKYILYAKTFSNSYGKHTSDEEEFDNSTDTEYEKEYLVTFLAGCMPSVTEDMNKISADYESPLLKSMDLGDIKEGFAIDESQNNETDDDVNSKDINVNIIPESNNILALLALIIICLVAIL